MDKCNSNQLNSGYKEVCEKLGMEVAVEIYKLFKGQQISFPVRLYNSRYIQTLIVQEYDGTNIKSLATKYGYSEKTVRRIIKGAADERYSSSDPTS